MKTASKSNFSTPQKSNMALSFNQGAVSIKNTAILTSSQAAHLLGISLTSAQKLLDLKLLKGWKTGKGHRRFTADSVLAYMNQGASNFPDEKIECNEFISILIAKENDANRHLIESNLNESNLNIKIKWVESISASLIELALGNYDAFIIDIPLEKEVNESFMMALTSYCKNHLAQPLSVLYYTSMLDPEINKSINWGLATVHFLPAPLKSTWLQAYITGVQDKLRAVANQNIP